MKKRIIIVHGWDGSPEENWFGWLREEMKNEGFQVIAPQLPNPEEPRISKWVPALAEAVGTPDSQTYFVGHSMGCQAIIRYLETLPDDVKIGGAAFVAGFLRHITNLEQDPIAEDVDREWIETPIDFQKVKNHIPESAAIFSDNDPYVTLDNQEDFREKLGSGIIIMNNMQHFSDGLAELPIVKEKLLEISKK